MGNKICSFRRNMVEERYTRPQRLVRQSSSVDYKKLRKLILSEKLAPCFDGVDDSELNSDLEECPICFFFYPSLNRSRCCMKGICTECFLQMKPSPATQLTQCPFCKSSSYTVEYRGAKTKEEKGIEQAEEQKVIDAKLRMRFEELENADEVRPVNRIQSALEIQSPNLEAMEVSNIDAADSSVVSAWNERQAEFGLDLEEIMMMEAIWRSIQDTSSQKGIKLQSSGSNRTGGSRMIGYPANESMTSSASISLSSGSISGGIASAVARIAERNIRQSGALSSVDDLAQTSQTQDENSILEHEIEHVGSSADHNFDDARSNNEGLTSTSTTDDDSWDSFSPCIVETNQEDSENEYNSDQDLVMEPNDTDTCSSSVHTISDEDSESLNSSDTYQNPTYSPHLEYFASKTNFREFANSNS